MFEVDKEKSTADALCAAQDQTKSTALALQRPVSAKGWRVLTQPDTAPNSRKDRSSHAGHRHGQSRDPPTARSQPVTGLSVWMGAPQACPISPPNCSATPRTTRSTLPQPLGCKGATSRRLKRNSPPTHKSYTGTKTGSGDTALDHVQFLPREQRGVQTWASWRAAHSGRRTYDGHCTDLSSHTQIHSFKAAWAPSLGPKPCVAHPRRSRQE